MRLRLIIASALVIVCGLFLIPQTFHQQEAPPKHETFEMHAKSDLINQDVALTDRLCRNQCAFHLQQVLTDAEQATDLTQLLQNMQTEHPNMVYLMYSSPNQKTVTAGDLGELEAEIKSQLEQAKQSLQKNRRYESAAFKAGGKSYFVTGQNRYDKRGQKHQMIAVVEHELLDQIQIQQKRNFRLVPYPNENRKRMQTMDAQTNEKTNPGSGPEQQGMSHYNTDEVVVKFNFEPTEEQLQQIRRDIHAESKEKSLNQTYVFRSSKLSANEMLEYFKSWDISYAEPHFLYLTNQNQSENHELTPNDELFYGYQWNLPVTETLDGWTISKGSEDVIVAVIDTGVDLNHSDLQGRLTDGLNVIIEGQPPMDDVGHGTHVAGVISALVNNNEGVAGMSWYNRVMPVKVLDQSGAGTTYAVAQGIIWAVDQGASVINLSLGNYANAAFLHDAIKYAYERDVVIVAATGNDSTSQPGYPAAYPEVLAVSAVDQNQRLASFSNYGHYVDVVAPGVSIASTYTDNRYAALSGTSMASPHVAALAAMIRSRNPALTNEEVMQIIRDTATDLGEPGKDPYYGYGQINVAAALMIASGQQPELYESEELSLAESIRRKIQQLFRF